MSTASLEEAATIAAEFISSLDNLPNEVQHLLAEIKHKDIRSQELHQEINKESAKYIRHSIRSASSGAPGQTLSAKDLAIPQTVKANYAEIDKLADEKIALAERIVQLIARAQTRLGVDMQKVLTLQGDDGPQLSGSHHSSNPSRTAMSQVVEHLRSASGPISTIEAVPLAVPSASSAPQLPPRKKQRIAGSTKLPSPAPVPSVASSIASGVGGGIGAIASQRSRLSQQVHPRQSPSRATRRATASVGPDLDEDAEGEDEPEDTAEDLGEVEEDKSLYCFCQKLSYGEMIACDNPDCHYQWFHLPCVNLKQPLPERWFCSECGGAAMERQRKGRKK